MPEPSSSGWVSEHWESAITGIAALGMLAREVWRMREERAKSLREAVKDQRDEGEGIFQRALTLLRETEDRYRRSETQLEAARAETERLQEVADGLAQQIARRGIVALLDELAGAADGAQEILDLLPVAAVVTRSDSGRFVAANASMCALLGRSLPELLAGSWRDWIVPEDLPDTASVETAALSRRVTVRNRYRLPSGDVVELQWEAVRYRPGGISFAVASVVD